jgi:hypothetical protein
MRPYTHSYMRTRARASGDIDGAAVTHNGRACVGDRPSAVRRGARGPEAAHTLDNVVTEAMFHAPMLALNAVAERNACEPINATLGGGVKSSHASARMRARPRTHTSARARAHARTAAPYCRPRAHGHVGMLRRGTDTHPGASVAQEPYS